MEAARVLVDTDLGDDVDDAYALALALRVPECRLAGVLTNSGHVLARARLARALLRYADRADVPVFAGIDGRGVRGFNHRAVAEDGERPGDPPGVEDALRLVRGLVAAGPLTWVSIGGLANAALVLDRLTPRERGRISWVVMGGSLERDYLGRAAATVEDNLGRDAEAARAVFARARSLALVPLDATWNLAMPEATRRRAHAGGPLGAALERCYARWREAYGWTTPVLHDPFTLALALDPSFARWREMRLEADARGFVRPSAAGIPCRVAMASDGERFLEWLDRRLGPAEDEG